MSEPFIMKGSNREPPSRLLRTYQVTLIAANPGARISHGLDTFAPQVLPLGLNYTVLDSNMIALHNLTYGSQYQITIRG